MPPQHSEENVNKREKKLDDDLRKFGYDPDQIGRMGEKLAMKCMAEQYEKLLAEKDESIATLQSQITELQIQGLKGLYTPMHEADRQRLKAENASLQGRVAELQEGWIAEKIERAHHGGASAYGREQALEDIAEDLADPRSVSDPLMAPAEVLVKKMKELYGDGKTEPEARP